MEIKILGRTELEQFVAKNSKQYDVVYYTHSSSPPIKLIEENVNESLHMPVDDIDHYEYKTHVSPTAESVKKFLDFGKGRKKLICACAAGVSRSSSTALVIAAQNCGVQAAFDYIDPDKHWPNRLNVYIGSILLDSPKLWQEYAKWCRLWKKIDPEGGGAWPDRKTISYIGFDKLQNQSKV